MAENNTSRSRPALTCSFCNYLAVTKGDYLNHVKRKHRFHPQFKVTCSFPSCKFTSKSWASFKVHVSRKHRNDVIQNVETSDNSILDEIDSVMSTTDLSRNEVQQQNNVLSCITNLCMKLECKHRCSQIALNELVDGFSNVIEMTDETNKNIIQQHLEALQTQYGRNKVYMNHWAYIPPEEIVMGYEYVTCQGRTIRKVQCGYYIPIESILRNLLHITHIREWFRTSNMHISTPKIWSDINHGSCIAENPYFVGTEYTAKLIMFYDDCEFCNPIGARTKKHSMGFVYVTFSDIPLCTGVVTLQYSCLLLQEPGT